MADMCALDTLHRKQKLSGQRGGLRTGATSLLEACHDFSLPLNMPLSVGNVPICYFESVYQCCPMHGPRLNLSPPRIKIAAKPEFS